jgi:hypothetical protein
MTRPNNCPDCDKPAESQPYRPRSSSSIEYAVGCRDDRCPDPKFVRGSTESEAIDKWNRATSK